MSCAVSRARPERLLLRTCQPLDLQREATHHSVRGLDLSQRRTARGIRPTGKSTPRGAGRARSRPCDGQIRVPNERQLWDAGLDDGGERRFDWLMLQSGGRVLPMGLSSVIVSAA